MKITKSFEITGLAHSKMREAIGAICVHWSLLELMVERVIAQLEDHPRSVTVKEDITRRLPVLKNLAKKLPPGAANKLRELAGEIKTLKDERHRPVHGLWGFDEHGNIHSIYFRDSAGQPDKPMSTNDMRQIKLKIWNLYQRLEKFAPLKEPAVPASPRTPH